MTYAEIEKTVISALKGNVPLLRSVEPYAGQLEDEIKELAVRLPAAFVVHGGSEFRWVDGASFRESVEFSVLIARRVTGTDSAGQELLEEALEALSFLSTGDGAERLMPVRAELLFTNRLIAVNAIEFRTGFDRAFKTT
ncbi:hypothetical protein LCGC14_3113150 [marine sediment metagenome]|uniref:Uncharacterized protein n=1 Tax=marine sediment metagenome TaxID=412755 RepID=A0A0F8WTH5_9ZZZZ